MSGVSGVGKTSIAYELLKLMPNLKRLVTYVTRQPRPNETNGTDYNFISREEFQKKLANNEFFEHDEHYGNYYGNSAVDLQNIFEQNKIALILLDPFSVKKIKNIFPKAKTIFIEPDNLENLKKHIRQRPMSDEAFNIRFAEVKKEMTIANTFDFRIINEENKLAEAVQKTLNYIKKQSSLD